VSGGEPVPAEDQGASVTGAIAKYSAAMMFCRAAAIVQGIVVIRLMEPAALGVWLGLQLIPIYGIHAHFGLVNAVNRLVPFCRGRDERGRAAHVENVARGNLALLALLGVCAALALLPFGVWNNDNGRGVVLLLVATAVSILVEFYTGLFRARHEFGKAGLANVINAVAIVAGLALVFLWGYDGLLWRAVAAALLTLLGCLAMDGWRFKITFDWGETLQLVRLGMPILALGYGVIVFASMDRTLILVFLDENAMGQYALCFAVARIVALFPNLVGQVYYPRMTETYAKSGISRPLLGLCAQASAVSAAVAGLVCGASYAILPRLVEYWFPKYTGGIPPLQIALMAYFLLSFTAGPHYFLISTVQKRRQARALLLAAATMLGAAYWLSAAGLRGIAWSLVLGVVVYVLGLWLVVLASLRKAGRARRSRSSVS
jgi:O-antigen/teichoic acid export membrane protein